MRRFGISLLFVCVLGTPVAAAPAPGGVHKPVVSVDDIRDLANTGKADVLREMIETTVVNTGKFRIMERGQQGTAVLLSEQQRAKAGLVTSRTPGKIGGFEGVDFKIYGTITTAGSGTSRDAGASAGMAIGRGILRSFGPIGYSLGSAMSTDCTVSGASLAIDIRITDAETGELRYAKHVTRGERGQTTCGGEAQVDIDGLLRRAAQDVSVGLVTTMYPVKVVGTDDDGQILLNYGEGLLEPGDVFALFQQGRSVIDPDTGAQLGSTDHLLGLVRISEVLPKMSKAATLTPLAAPPPIGTIAREATPEQMQSLAPAKPPRRR